MPHCWKSHVGAHITLLVLKNVVVLVSVMGIHIPSWRFVWLICIRANYVELILLYLDLYLLGVDALIR